MTTVLAILAGIIAFFGTSLLLSVATTLLANAHQLFALLFRVQPYRTVTTMLILFASTWVGFSVFDALR
jgi:hypothetical protein